MENSFRYFKNTDCKYYPCHKVPVESDFNCLFCYCPMNCYDDCLGTPVYIQTASGKKMKDCSNCTFPHQPENYEKMMEFLGQKL